MAFYSWQLQGAETKYTVTELEVLAIVAAIQHFEFYLYGAPVVVFTDHKACTSVWGRISTGKMKIKMETEQIDSQFFFMYIDVCYLWFHVVFVSGVATRVRVS